jgi:hypothetical protein
MVGATGRSSGLQNNLTEEYQKMPKYYVQCGPIQTILLADSVDHAALCALDSTLQNHLWIYDDPGLSDQNQHDHLMLEALLHLEATVRISERGFDRLDAQLVGTPETVENWHALMVGMNRLFVAAGLTPRSMQAMTQSSATVTSTHRRCPK